MTHIIGGSARARPTDQSAGRPRGIGVRRVLHNNNKAELMIVATVSGMQASAQVCVLATAAIRHVRSPKGPVPAEPTRPLPRLRVGGRQARGHSPADLDICEPGSPVVPGAKTDRHRATSSPRRSWPGTASGAPNAVGARNGSQRVQPPSDVARPDQILLAGQWLPVRLSPIVTDSQNGFGIP
jgi:hypothetical protein